MSWGTDTTIADLVGKTFVDVVRTGEHEIWFKLADGGRYVMYHSQDCCEQVIIEDLNGDLDDLIGTPILMADEASSSNSPPPWEMDRKLDGDDSCTWTFYHISTIKGSVSIRWWGESNGYYSESVDVSFYAPDQLS